MNSRVTRERDTWPPPRMNTQRGGEGSTLVQWDVLGSSREPQWSQESALSNVAQLPIRVLCEASRLSEPTRQTAPTTRALFRLPAIGLRGPTLQVSPESSSAIPAQVLRDARAIVEADYATIIGARGGAGAGLPAHQLQTSMSDGTRHTAADAALPSGAARRSPTASANTIATGASADVRTKPLEPTPCPKPRSDERQRTRPNDHDASQPAPANMFRLEALRAKTDEPVALPLPEVSSNGWTVLCLLAALLVVATAAAFLGHVEETSQAHGVLLVEGGPKPVLAQVSGPIVALDVTPGTVVGPGQSIARIDAAELSARVQRDADQLALVQTDYVRLNRLNDRRYQNDVRVLEQKRGLLNERAKLKSKGMADRQDRLQQVEDAARAGVATQSDALSARESARSASEELLLIRQQVAEVDLELASDKKAYEVERDRLHRELEESKSNLQQAQHMLEMTTVRAPVGGRVESLLAAQGQVVNTGTVVARIIPDGAVTSAVAFAPIKDAAFLAPGLPANLELASFPVSEFGRVPGRVTRVSNDVASAEDVTTLLSQAPTEALIRVELELLPSDKLAQLWTKLRSGERLIARINTRERRLIALVFDFLRNWFEP